MSYNLKISRERYEELERSMANDDRLQTNLQTLVFYSITGEQLRIEPDDKPAKTV